MLGIFLIFLLTPCAHLSLAQSDFKRNDIYLEAGGTGLFGSVNYERHFSKAPALSARVGVGFYSENAFYLSIPAGIHYLFKLKKKNTFIDAGVGVSWIRLDAVIFDDKYSLREHFVNFTPSIGYRGHTQKDVMWRISITPVANNSGLYPWIGASLGKRF